MPFIRENCETCGDCLVACQYLELNQQEAEQEMKNLIEKEASFVLQACMTCYACNEYCEKGANPFDLIAELQTKHNSLEIKPEMAPFLAETYGVVEYTGSTELSGPLMLQCYYQDSIPEAFEGRLFEGLTLAAGPGLKCNMIFLHSGQYDLIKEQIELAVANVAKFGADEAICFHDECYAYYKLYAPQFGVEVPFKPIHIFEYVVDYLKIHSDAITPLNMKIAYQRSCSSRLTPEKDHFLDELLELIGVERVQRTYDYKNALCCQAPGMVLSAVDEEKLDPEVYKMKSNAIGKYQSLNIKDAIQAGASAMVSVCPVCQRSLAEPCKAEGLEPILITDLVRMALGELPVPESIR